MKKSLMINTRTYKITPEIRKRLIGIVNVSNFRSYKVQSAWHPKIDSKVWRILLHSAYQSQECHKLSSAHQSPFGCKWHNGTYSTGNRTRQTHSKTVMVTT